jgi:GNAT superfamily N-acetyltransferase
MATSTVPRTGPTARREPPPPRRAGRAAHRVRVLGPADETAAALLLARAFAIEPGNVALYPDPAVRHTMLESGMRGMFRTVVAHGTAHGVEVDGRLGAVALWEPPGVRVGVRDLPTVLQPKLEVAPMIVRALPGATRRILRDPRASLRLVRARARGIAAASAGPTWHLAFLGVDPEHQGEGLARRLLDRQLVRCDEDGLPAWLETTDEANPPIYERFGFRTITHLDAAAWLPGWWAMRRDPRP